MDGVVVLVDGQPLDERYALKKFTSGGFEWTYEGAGPNQLALALLADHLGDNQAALDLCEPFMRAIVADFENDWELTGQEIDEALTRLKANA